MRQFTGIPVTSLNEQFFSCSNTLTKIMKRKKRTDGKNEISCPKRYAQQNLFQILLNQSKIRLYYYFWMDLEQQTDTVRLILNQSVHGKYNPILVRYSKISKRFIMYNGSQHNWGRWWDPYPLDTIVLWCLRGFKETLNKAKRSPD